MFTEITNLVFNGNYIYIALSILSLMVVLKNRQHCDKSVVLFVYFSCLTLTVIIYNPLIRLLFEKIPDSGIAVFARLWCVIPLWFLISYSFSLFFATKTYNCVAYGALITIALLLCICGESIATKGMSKKPDNVFKINDMSVDLVNELKEVTNEESSTLLIILPDTDSVEREEFSTFYNGITQFTGFYNVYVHLYDEHDWEEYISNINQNNCESSGYAHSIISFFYRRYGIEYVVLQTDEMVIYNLNNYGYEAVGESDGYTIIKVS